MKRGLFIFTGLLVFFLIGLTSAGYCSGDVNCFMYDDETDPTCFFLEGIDSYCEWSSGDPCSSFDNSIPNCNSNTDCNYNYEINVCESNDPGNIFTDCTNGFNWGNDESCSVFDNTDQSTCEADIGCTWNPGCLDDSDCSSYGTDWVCQGEGGTCSDNYIISSVEQHWDGTDYTPAPWDWDHDTYYSYVTMTTAEGTFEYVWSEPNMELCAGNCNNQNREGYRVIGDYWYKYTCEDQIICITGNDLVWEDQTYYGPAYLHTYSPCSPFSNTDETNCESHSGCTWADTYGSCVDTCTPWTNTQFCANIIGSNSCETVNANDNCGDPRVVNCGTCETWESCNNNVCETTSPLSECEECTDNSQCASGSCQETLEFASTSRCVPVDYCPTDDASNCAISVNDNICYNDELRSCGHEPTNGNFYTWNAEPYATITDCPLGCIDGEDVCLEAPSTYDTCENCIGGGHEWCDTDGGNDLCLFAGTTECVDGQGGNPISLEANCQDPITEYDNCETCLEDEENFWCANSEEGSFCWDVIEEFYCTDDVNDGGVEGYVLTTCEGLPGDPTPNPELLWTDLDGEDITGNTISMGVSTLPQSVNVVYQDTLLNMPQTFTILEYDLIGGYKEVGTVDATSDAENYLNGTLTIDLALLSAAGNEARYEFYFEINGTRSEILRINTDELPVTHWKDSQGNDYAENNRYDLDRDYLISNSITLQMYYLNGDGTETFDLYANGHYIDSYDSSLVASSAYDWAPTCEQLSAIGANEQNFDFYFETAAEPNPSATLEVRFDEAIPDSCQLAEEEILFDVNVCSDYPNQAYCEADSKGVAQNSKESVDPNKRLGCFWDGSTCGTRVISSYGGADIGNCSYIEDTSSDPDKCDNNFLTYTWTAVWNWAFPLNYYNSLNDCELDNTPGTCVEDPDISGRFYYDPIGARSDCQNGEATISCPAKVALDFFSLKNLFAAIILIVAIYLIMDRYKKPTKKKSTKKKVVKKK